MKNALTIGEINKFQSLIMTIIPKKLTKILGLNAILTGPINELGDYFKKMMWERKKNGIKYNDLTEMLQDAVDANKVQLTENEIIGKNYLKFITDIKYND